VETSKLLRLGGLAAVLSGAALAVYNLVEFIAFSGAPLSSLANLPGWVALNIAGLVGIALLVVGLFALYAIQAQRAGVLGIIGFSLVLLGVLQYYGVTWAEAFLLPSVGRGAPAVVDTPDPLLSTGLISTVLLSTLGFVVFAVATLRAGVLPRWTAALMILGAVVPFVTQGVGSALPIGPVALGVSLIGMGYAALGWGMHPLLRRAPA
jgi:hypothetical protein